MIKIITDKVKFPEDFNQLKYKKFKSNNLSNTWHVYDTEKGLLVYEGSYEGASLACHNLNKKHYKNVTPN